ncbi:hypothetical protein ACIPC1_15590 [Streptomyces sp. NPDC087263]
MESSAADTFGSDTSASGTLGSDTSASGTLGPGGHEQAVHQAAHPVPPR